MKDKIKYILLKLAILGAIISASSCANFHSSFSATYTDPETGATVVYRIEEAK